MNAVGGMMGGMPQENSAFAVNQNSAFAAGENAPQMPGQAAAQSAEENPNPANEPQPQQSFSDVTAKLLDMKKLFDAGVISQEEFEAVKKQLLGL
ncbi:SHOCT domain-containing protein [Arcanobacterium hippocoleae]